MMILGVIFLIACFNTCVGLLSYCSQYFTTIIPVIGYKVWVFVFAAVSLVISSAGLNRILTVSEPVLNAIYPVAIVLIVLAFRSADQEMACHVSVQHPADRDCQCGVCPGTE